MAINDNSWDDGLDQDPKLARLYQAASAGEPPAALDAAILAAARREVHARPQVAGAGQTSIPPARAMHVKRNWYVPVSIAAVLVMSVSLVTLVHQEKGDELAQPPRSASVPPPAVTADAAKSDDALRDAAPAKPKLAEENRTDSSKESAQATEKKGEAKTKAAPAPDAYSELAKKQRTEKTESAESAVASANARKDQPAGTAMHEQVAPTAPEAEASGRMAQERQRSAIDARRFEGPAVGGAAPSAAPPPPPPRAAATPEPFPAQAPASRDSAEARPRPEVDRNSTRGAPSPSVSAAPAAPSAAAPRRSAPAEDATAQAAPSSADGSAAATPAPKPAAKSALRLMAKPAPLWRGLEDQPPEKWLERLAEFRRDNRQADADELLAEFRRRFPDHPASAR